MSTVELAKEERKRSKRERDCCDSTEFTYAQCCCSVDGKEVTVRGYDRDCEGCVLGWRC